MLTQPKPHRKGGFSSDADFLGGDAETQALSGFNPPLRANADERESGNTTDQRLQSRSREIVDWKIGRLDNLVKATTQAGALVCVPYSSKNQNFACELQSNADGELAVWPIILQTLSATVPPPSFRTWIEPCHFDSLADDVLTLSVNGEFTREIISRRYRRQIEAAAELVFGTPTRLRMLVDETLAVQTQPEAPTATLVAPEPVETEGPTISSKYPMARFQNPTNNPQVALLLEKHGDLRGVMKNDPFFKRIQRPVAEGGWGTELGGLISLAKAYTLERVLWAAKQAKDYQGVHTSRGAVFNHIVRKGLEGVK